jgi:hypothetical protein
LSDCRNEDNGGEIVDGEAVVSGCDTLPIFEPSEHALDDVSAPVHDAVERIDDGTGGSARDDGFDTSVLEPIAEPISVIGFVSYKPLGRRQGFEHRHGHGDVGNVARRQRDGDDPATTIQLTSERSEGILPMC